MSKIALQRFIVKNGNDESSINHFIDDYYKEDLENTKDINLKRFYLNRISYLKDEISGILPDFKKNIKKFDKTIDLFNYFIKEKKMN